MNEVQQLTAENDALRERVQELEKQLSYCICQCETYNDCMDEPEWPLCIEPTCIHGPMQHSHEPHFFDERPLPCGCHAPSCPDCNGILDEVGLR